MTLVHTQQAAGVATVTMNRPERLNTMTDPFLEELLAALEQVADDRGVRAVVLRGAGSAFCAGGDLKAGVGGGVGDAGSLSTATGNLRRFMRIAQLLHLMPKPTIAAVHGACAGAGLSLACAADLRYASRSAVFVTAFLKVGMTGDFGGTWTLPRIVGRSRAREAYLLGDRIDARKALDWGLVTEVLDSDDELHQRVEDLARGLAAGPTEAQAGVKANLNDGESLGFVEALDREAARHIRSSRSVDAVEATKAFLEKRVPTFHR
ncbi:enoyl-CoA hydratase [Amycolatopsis rhabdoformis]|uniref:Enoyl-CoA hydratase n=1 Tax=Amycolatopsis rhabdoformis TaxID=1448059 RepID=A0ABZ1IKH3_9PSEU|nr:enoyl-CoA hydratase [Amycolatopsis rhabdoformis]WSE34747.1 enoyl-CoA hydratase [Amycolatopsis rhabdoformis]